MQQVTLNLFDRIFGVLVTSHSIFLETFSQSRNVMLVQKLVSVIKINHTFPSLGNFLVAFCSSNSQSTINNFLYSYFSCPA